MKRKNSSEAACSSRMDVGPPRQRRKIVEISDTNSFTDGNQRFISLYNFFPNEFLLRNELENRKTLLVRCTACGLRLNIKETELKKHRRLDVVTCTDCYSFYGSDEFSEDESGGYKYCTWCGQGGKLSMCDYCPNGFCNACILRNFGERGFSETEKNGWRCYVCDNEPLQRKMRFCDLLIASKNGERISLTREDARGSLNPNTNYAISEPWLEKAFDESEVDCKVFCRKMLKLKTIGFTRKKSLKHIVKKAEEVIKFHKAALKGVVASMQKNYASFIKEKLAADLGAKDPIEPTEDIETEETESEEIEVVDLTNDGDGDDDEIMVNRPSFSGCVTEDIMLKHKHKSKGKRMQKKVKLPRSSVNRNINKASSLTCKVKVAAKEHNNNHNNLKMKKDAVSRRKMQHEVPQTSCNNDNREVESPTSAVNDSVVIADTNIKSSEKKIIEASNNGNGLKMKIDATSKTEAMDADASEITATFLKNTEKKATQVSTTNRLIMKKNGASRKKMQHEVPQTSCNNDNREVESPTSAVNDSVVIADTNTKSSEKKIIEASNNGNGLKMKIDATSKTEAMDADASEIIATFLKNTEKKATQVSSNNRLVIKNNGASREKMQHEVSQTSCNNDNRKVESPTSAVNDSVRRIAVTIVRSSDKKVIEALGNGNGFKRKIDATSTTEVMDADASEIIATFLKNTEKKATQVSTNNGLMIKNNGASREKMQHEVSQTSCDNDIRKVESPTSAVNDSVPFAKTIVKLVIKKNGASEKRMQDKKVDRPVESKLPTDSVRVYPENPQLNMVPTVEIVCCDYLLKNGNTTVTAKSAMKDTMTTHCDC